MPRFRSFNKFLPRSTEHVNEWYNAVQVQINLSKVSPQDSKNIALEMFSGFSYEIKISMSRTITEGSLDLDRFPMPV